MNNLYAFTHPVKPEEKEIYISDRFRDEDGNVVPFRIRPLTQEENDALVRKARLTKTVNGIAQEYADSAALSHYTVLAATVEPDFSSKELCDAYGVLDPSLVPGKMLLSGEYAKLMQEISAISGFDNT